MTVEVVLTAAVSALSLLQTGYLFRRKRHDTLVDQDREAWGDRMVELENDLKEHIKEEPEMRERIRTVETKLEGTQRSLDEINSRHGELVSRLDKIQTDMLTKDDLKLLISVFKDRK